MMERWGAKEMKLLMGEGDPPSGKGVRGSLQLGMGNYLPGDVD